jgi:hypothetical protein
MRLREIAALMRRKLHPVYKGQWLLNLVREQGLERSMAQHLNTRKDTGNISQCRQLIVRSHYDEEYSGAPFVKVFCGRRLLTSLETAEFWQLVETEKLVLKKRQYIGETDIKELYGLPSRPRAGGR